MPGTCLKSVSSDVLVRAAEDDSQNYENMAQSIKHLNFPLTGPVCRIYWHIEVRLQIETN